jgi:hypothetical protein
LIVSLVFGLVSRVLGVIALLVLFSGLSWRRGLIGLRSIVRLRALAWLCSLFVGLAYTNDGTEFNPASKAIAKTADKLNFVNSAVGPASCSNLRTQREVSTVAL